MPYSKYNDSELAAMLSQKKSIAEPAFSELYSRYSRRIFAYCLKVLGNREDASDVFQDTFIRFYNKAKEEVIIGNIPGYIITIARNLCLNYKRDRKPLQSLEDYQTPAKNYTDDTVEHNEQISIVQKALDKLPIEYREAFVLRQYQGYSYQEIAELTAVPSTTVKNRVWRAKEKMKVLLAPFLKDY